MKIIIHKLGWVILCLFLSLPMIAQIGISNSGQAPDPSAMLDVRSTEKGFLTPRMTANERAAIASPATGLLVFQTTDPVGFYYNQGSADEPDWVKLGGEGDIKDLQTRIPIDSVAFFASYNGTYANYVITEPGSYYLTDTFSIRQSGGNGIVIDADNVTLDMNGFAIYGDGPFNVNNGSTPGGNPLSDPGGSGSGILVDGEQFNITIRDGYLNSWQDDGIHAPDVRNSIFQNLSFRYNGQNGMTLGDQNLIDNCVSFWNVLDGIHVGVANNLINCRGENNGESCIQADSSSQFIACVAANNFGDGITAGPGSLALGCSILDNDGNGMLAARDCNMIKVVSHNNGQDGIKADENSVVRECVVSNNEASGIHLIGENGGILNNVSYRNEDHGIFCSNTTMTDIKVDGNSMIDNQTTGLTMISAGGLVVRNVAAGQLTTSSYTLHPDTNRGPVVNVAAVGDISTVPNSDHPLANFIY
ncbi:MAG: right-handed parallel beta-helix repeat-containing protein [Bacteroidota bacterium]